jgi:TolB-like protein
MSETVFFDGKESIQTMVPALNIALSGSINGGFKSGFGLIAGPSRHFKSSIMLMLASAFLKKYSDGIILYYDSEFGAVPGYFKSFDIDLDRVHHNPISDVEQMKSDIMNQLKEIERGDKVMIIVDSFGNLASKKEVTDALDEKNVADFSRSKSFKSFGRMVTPQLSIKDIPFVAVAHTYETMEMYSKQVVSGGCLEKGTKIKLSDGTLKVVEDFIIGDFVQTMDGCKEVTAVWDPSTLDDGEPDCFEIEFEDGTKIVCSDTHKFLVNNEWVDAKNLISGDDVITKM